MLVFQSCSFQVCFDLPCHCWHSHTWRLWNSL